MGVAVIGAELAFVPAAAVADAAPSSAAELPALASDAPADPPPPPVLGNHEISGDGKAKPRTPDLTGTKEVVSERGRRITVVEDEAGRRTARLFTRPVNYLAPGMQWKRIDSRLVDDPDNPGMWRSKANDWVARFGTSGLEVETNGQVFKMVPEGRAETLTPVVDAEAGTVTYKDAWPSADLRYTVEPDAVKEDIIVKGKGRTDFAFDVDGADFAQEGERLAATGALVGKVALAAPEVFDHNGRPTDAAKPKSQRQDPTSQTPEQAAAHPGPRSRVAVSVDQGWLNGRSASQFPVTIDPTAVLDPGFYRDYRSDGPTCDANTCGVRVGNSRAAGDTHWRTVADFDYQDLFGDQILGANLKLTKVPGSATGTDVSTVVAVHEASSWGYAGKGQYLAQSNMTTSATLSSAALTALLNTWTTNSTPDRHLMIVGEESAGLYTYKSMDAELDVSYSIPVIGVPIGPADGATVTTLTPQLGVHPGGDGVQYEFVVATNPAAVKTASNATSFISLKSTARTWNVPANLLNDGVTYFWGTRTTNADGFVTFPKDGFINKFRIDRRLGDDGTQSYDAMGPVKVDLATGNALIGVQTRSVSTVAGPVGLSLSYNSLGKDPVGAYAGATKILPAGWTMSIGSDTLDYAGARVAPDSVVLYSPEGVVHEYKASSGGFTPPAGEHGVLSTNPDGTVSLLEEDGSLYAFNADGTLKSATSGEDDLKPAAWTYSYSGGRLTTVTDPVSARPVATLSYGCDPNGAASNPSGFDATAPTNMLCSVTLPGATPGTTDIISLWYVSGRLARAEEPGGQVSDFGYDALNRVVSVRDPLAADAVAHGDRADDSTTQTQVAYVADAANPDRDGRVDYVQLPAPNAGDSRPKHTYTYRTAEQTAGFFAYTSTWTGGVDVAVGNIAPSSPGDELVTAPGAGGGPDVRTFKADGTQLATEFNAYDATMSLGVNVATGDLDGNGTDEIVTGVGPGGGPHVRWFNADGTLYQGFNGVFPYTNFTGGVDVATGDLDGNGTDEIITGAGPGGGPHVKYFDAAGNELGNFFAYDAAFAGGVRVSAADVDHDGKDEIITGPGSGGGPHLRVWKRQADGSIAEVQSLGVFAFDTGFDGGLDVAGARGRDLVSAGTLTEDAAVRIPAVASWFRLPFDDFRGGAHVSAGDTDGDGVAQLAVAAGPGGGPHVKVLGPYGVTTVDVAGTAAAVDQQVVYDDALRTVETTDATGKRSTTTWDPDKDQALAGTDPAGRISTTTYDDQDRVIATAGPALPGTADAATPKTTTAYDENITGLAASYWNNTALTGPPIRKLTASPLNFDLVGAAPTTGINADNFSARFTGDLKIPSSGDYQFRVTKADDGVRLFIDDQQVLDQWSFLGSAGTPVTRTFNDPAPNTWHRIRVDYKEETGGASMSIEWLPPGGAWQAIDAANLRPGYGLVTTSTTQDATAGSEVTTTNYGQRPELGLALTTTTDPAGASLTTATSYEDAVTGISRRLTKTLPGGNIRSYAHYGIANGGSAETADDPCTTGTQVYNQAGLPKTEIGPDPDGAGTGLPRQEETVYDEAGRVIASRAGSIGAQGAWSCTSYDARGRVGQRVVPAWDQEPQHTYDSTYAVGGNPLSTKVTDTVAGQIVGTIATVTDLLGRVTSYTDVWGKTTTTAYDQAGRVTQTQGPAGTVVPSYDDAGRVTQQKLDGSTVAQATYDAAGELSSVDYPSGSGKAGNGTGLTVTRDAVGRTSALTWKKGSNLIASDAVTYSQGGKVVDQSVDGVDANPSGANFTYDGAGRLTRGYSGADYYDYEYAPTGGCGALTTAGKNTNRTAARKNGVVTASYCYDSADRLFSTTDTRYNAVSYDDRGNTTALGGQVLRYDGADRHMATEVGPTKIHYTRDATDRIVARDVTGAPAGPNTVTPAFRDASSASNGAGGTSIVLNKPTGTQPGDVMVAQVAAGGGSGTTITAPSGWTQLDSKNNGTLVAQKVFWRLATGNEPASWTWTLSSSQEASGGVLAYSGVEQVTPLDVTANNKTAAASTSHVAPAVVTTKANDELVTFYGLKTGTTMTAPSGMTERFDLASTGGTVANQLTAGADDQLVAITGSTGTRTATSAAAADSVSASFALKAMPSYSTIAFRSASSATNGAGASSLALQTPTGVAAGDVMIAQVAAGGGSNTTITAPAGWTAVDTKNNGTKVNEMVAWKVATASEPATSAWTLTGTPEASGGVVAYSGVDGTAPVDVFSDTKSASSGTSHIASTVVTPRSNDQLLSFFALKTGTSLTPPTGMTERWDAASTGGTVANQITALATDQAVAAPGDTGTRTATSAAAADSAMVTVALKPAAPAANEPTSLRYGFSGDGDSPDFTMDGANNVIERSIGLIGGVTLTKRSPADVWSYSNIHGDIMAVADGSGSKQGTTMRYDPFGGDLGALPDNAAGNYDFGWLGSQERGLEHLLPAVATIEMGARQYVPGLGRFLQVDPIEGGCANEYMYVHGDPVNAWDFNGKANCDSIFQKIRRALFGDSYGARGQTGMKGVVSRWVKQKAKMSKDWGHKQAYENDQKYLRKQIKKYDDNNCWDGPNAGRQSSYVRVARQWAHKQYPWPTYTFKLGPLRWSPIMS
ncbi:MAG: hypothetical protein QOE35_3542 [Actinomycetota bacterium]|jgi:RHS repeat-associated protein